MKTVRELADELKSAQAWLASLQEKLGGARYARRMVRERIAVACIRQVPPPDGAPDDEKGVVLSWRAPNPEEVARIDEVCAQTAPIIAELTPLERAAKEAVRVLGIELKNARKAAAEDPSSTPRDSGKTAARLRQGSAAVVSRTLKGKRTTARVPQFAAETAANYGTLPRSEGPKSVSPRTGSAGEQGELF